MYNNVNAMSFWMFMISFKAVSSMRTIRDHALNLLRSSAFSGIRSVPSIVVDMCLLNKVWPTSGSSDAIHFLYSS